MPTSLFFSLPDSLIIEGVFREDERVTLELRSVQLNVSCPDCGQSSSHVHSRYIRTLADLPSQGQTVRLQVQVRRFFCVTSTCARKTFAEPLADLAPAFARRTTRQSEALHQIALALGGKAGAHLAKQLAMPVSLSTLLRLIRGSSIASFPPPQILGVDDFAWKKGDRYGTLLVDLERHQPIDVLPDREATSLATWLREHPGVCIISRDRAGAYAEGARKGAPEAIQVADRFHLLLNLRQAIKELLDRQGTLLPFQELKRSSGAEPTDEAGEPPLADSLCEQGSPERHHRTMSGFSYRPAVASKQDVHRQARRSQRLARYEAVRELHRQGLSLNRIAEQLEISLRTVRHFVRAESFPELHSWPKQGSKLDPYVPYLLSRWQAGCYNGMQLYQELLAQGYPGSRVLVSRFVADLRRKGSIAPSEGTERAQPGAEEESRCTHSRRRRLTSRQASWLFVVSPTRLTQEQRCQLAQLCQSDDQLQRVYQLAQQFVRLLKERQPEALPSWLEQAEQCHLRELSSLALGLRRDYAAVQAACSLPWSNGQVEGQITRLKLLKRQMYGRAKFDLLRLRVLHVA
jgi:transposase